MTIPVYPTNEPQQGPAPQVGSSRPNLRVDLFVDPACWWSFLTYQLLAQVAPHRQLDVHLRPYSLLLRAQPEHLEDWKVAVWGASLRAVRVMQAIEERNTAGMHPLYQALIARGLTAFRAGRVPFADDVEAALTAAGLPPGYAAAADDASRDEPIRRSMDEASAVVGEGVGTPALVLQRDRPVGLLGPVVSGPTTEAEALRVWDAVAAFLAAPTLLELSRPRPPWPAIRNDPPPAL